MPSSTTEINPWDLIITAESENSDSSFDEIWSYRELIFLFVKRDFITHYKQTVLGPLWYILQPLMTTLVFTVIFGKIAQIPTDGINTFLFYLSGIMVWGYLANCINQTSDTFLKNAGIFDMTYFPRLTIPISVVLSQLVHLTVQFALFLGFYIYFLALGSSLRPTILVLALPLVIFQVALLGLSLGLIVSSLTVKYRDLAILSSFAIQLWMFLSPVVYPTSLVPDKFISIYMLNPMASIIEVVRYSLLGHGILNPVFISLSWVITGILFLIGIKLFSKTEKTFLDTI